MAYDLVGWLADQVERGLLGGSGGSPIVQVVSQAAQPAIDTDLGNVFTITGIAQAITSMTTNLSGTPVHGQEMWVELQDNGTPRAITWGAMFTALNVPLPTLTVSGVLLSVLFKFNAITSTWECILVTGGPQRDPVDKSLAIAAPFDIHLMTTAVAPGSANMHGVRVVVPKTGTLHDITTWCGNAGTGHLMFGVYDTGQASAGNRTRLAVSGSLANPGVANSWFPVWDPALPVVEGQQLDLVYQSDSTTDTYGRGTNVANIAQLSLPAGYLKPGNVDAPDPTVNPYLGWFGTNTFGSLPATIADAAVTAGDGPVFIMGRVG